MADVIQSYSNKTIYYKDLEVGNILKVLSTNDQVRTPQIKAEDTVRIIKIEIVNDCKDNEKGLCNSNGKCMLLQNINDKNKCIWSCYANLCGENGEKIK